jgi:hypothetical protein
MRRQNTKEDDRMTQQYREVKRKAAVGERIKVTNAWATGGLYKNGDVFIVTETHAEHEGAVIGVAERLSAVSIVVGEYVVLEPVTESIAPSPLSADPLYAAFRQFVADNAAEIRAILPELMEARTDGHYTITSERGLTFVPTLTRAAIIAKATADIEELLRIGHDAYSDLPAGTPFHDRMYTAKFHVNRDKRTVTALVNRGISLERIADAKFTAKCSPADVFHAEIGKAIALRKALGLTVPTEYTDAPQPDGKNANMIVRYEGKTRKLVPSNLAVIHGETAHIGSIIGKRGTILDDTDVDYSAVSAKGVAA